MCVCDGEVLLVDDRLTIECCICNVHCHFSLALSLFRTEDMPFSRRSRTVFPIPSPPSSGRPALFLSTARTTWACCSTCAGLRSGFCPSAGWCTKTSPTKMASGICRMRLRIGHGYKLAEIQCSWCMETINVCALFFLYGIIHILLQLVSLATNCWKILQLCVVVTFLLQI